MRYLAAQFLALLEGGLWLASARQANAMAQRLAGHLRGMPGVRLWQAVESNAVFACLEPAHIERLQRDWVFEVWNEAEHAARWMTSFDTTPADVDRFAESIRAAGTGLG
jgi:threonine aldolase